MFELDNTANVAGTSRVGTLTARYADIEQKFGKPIESDGYKVSGEWIFRDKETGDVFTVYDYKLTDLYDQSLPTVGQFRKTNEPHDFSIGGRKVSEKFEKWLRRSLWK